MSAGNDETMGRLTIQLSLDSNIWSTRYSIPKNDRYSNSAAEWTLVSLKFTVFRYGNKLIYDEIDNVLAGMCFSDITITQFVI